MHTLIKYTKDNYGEFYSTLCRTGNNKLFNYDDWTMRNFYLMLGELTNFVTSRLTYGDSQKDFHSCLDAIHNRLEHFKTFNKLDFICGYSYDYGDVPRTYNIGITLNESLGISLAIDTTT